MADNVMRITEKDLEKMALPVDFDPAQVRNTVLDVQYGTLPEQKLDIYLPDEKPEGLIPVLFYVHGGGWTMGTKRLGALDCIIAAVKHGYAIIAPDYRLAPGVCYPEFIYDIKAAVRWARAHAAEYGFDPERFGMLGDSAGGHITLMMGFTANQPQFEGNYGNPGFSTALQAVCDMYGPSLLDADEVTWYRESGMRRMVMGDETDPNGEGKELYGKVFGTRNLSLLGHISPYNHIHKDIPPILIQQGMEDSVVPYQHSALTAEKIAAVCGQERVQLKLYPDRNHSDKQFMTERNCEEVLEFFDKYLK